jgi:hypothetical protein
LLLRNKEKRNYVYVSAVTDTNPPYDASIKHFPPTGRVKNHICGFIPSSLIPSSAETFA